ncbi:MAG: tetratricopeptide repeat protein [Bacteroidetes bacterium]|nr:MAG: tetratricopeptide repeat protein [Bacteroidota bacterium]
MKKITFILLITFTLPFSTFAQQQNNKRDLRLDSLLQIDIHKLADSTQADLYLERAKMLNTTHADSSIACCIKALSIAKKGLLNPTLTRADSINYIRLMAQAHFSMGMIDQIHSRLDSAEKKYLRAVSLFKETDSRQELSNLYNYLSRIYQWNGDQQLFYDYTKKASQIQRQEKDSIGLAMSSIAFGAYFERTGNVDSCLSNYEKALRILRVVSSDHELSFGLNEYGYVLQRMGLYEKAVVILLEALDINKKRDDEHFQTTKTLSAIGTVFSELGEYEKAESYLNEAVQLSREMENPSVEAGILSKLGIIYSKREEHQKSLAYHLKAQELIQNTDVPPSLLAIALHNIGKQYQHLGETQKAILNFEQALELGRKYSLPKDQAVFLNSLADAHLQINQLQSAKEYALEAFSVGSIKNYSEVKMKAASILHQFYYQNGDYKNALEYITIHFRIKDSLQSVNSKAALLKMESSYILDQKQQQISSLENENKARNLEMIHQKALAEQRRQDQMLIALAIILLMCIILFFINRDRLQRKNRLLHLHNEQIKLEKEREKSMYQLELARTKHDLYANVTHEFRTPITLIQAPVKKLMAHAPDNVRETYQSILRNTNHLLQMVDEMLDLARLETTDTKLHYSITNLNLLIAETKADFAPLFQHKSIRFNANISHSDLSISTDRNRLKMVLNNLLKNAWHHCPEGGDINITVTKQDSELLLSVINQQESEVDSSDVEKLFERHYRGNTENYDGNGLGLAISKEIVNLLGGNITIDLNEPNKTEFSIRLPLKPVSAFPNQGSATINTDKATPICPMEGDLKPRVLVVEDNLEMQRLLRDLLDTRFEIILARDGEEAGHLAVEKQPALILSDLMMPKVDGIELVEFVKKNVDTSHIPVILLTAKSDKESRMLGLKHDADDYISKPFDPDELIARMDNLLRQRRHLHEAFKNNPFASLQNTSYTQLDRSFLKKAGQIVEKNYQDGDYTVHQFCTDLALNRSSVHKKLIALTNQSASQFIQNIRLTKAADQLLHTNASIDGIIYDNGFNSRQAFYKAFKAKFGQTPKEFREQKVMS